jgi:peptide deformylase
VGPALGTLDGMATQRIRTYGDPVLRGRTKEVDEIDGTLVKLVDDMVETMYDAPGTGLAANQVGVQRRIFVYDVGDGPRAVINPVIEESAGEWSYEEGCLSVPGLSWTIVRPNQVHLRGIDLEGNEISIEAEEFEGRVFQHELDHLDGILLVERLDDEQRREAKRLLRSRALALPASDADGLSNLLPG